MTRRKYPSDEHRNEQLRDRNRRGLCRGCPGKVQKGKSLCPRCRKKARIYNRAGHENLRDLILSKYGNACACCGECNPKFLSIDHKYGGGGKHRAGKSSRRVMMDIIEAGFPPKYQILCFNCNCGENVNKGVCPHEEDYL